MNWLLIRFLCWYTAVTEEYRTTEACTEVEQEQFTICTERTLTGVSIATTERQRPTKNCSRSATVVQRRGKEEGRM